MLISIDDQLVGVLPLVRPLLVSPGEHRVVLERRSTRLEDLVRVAVGRLGELRVNAATKALVLTVLPGVLLRQSLPSGFAAEQAGFEQTSEAVLTGRRLSALTERDSAECGEPAPGACSDPLRCEVDKARHCRRTTCCAAAQSLPGPPAARVGDRLIDVSLGAVAANATLRCTGCAPLRSASSFVRSFGAPRPAASVRPAAHSMSRLTWNAAMVFVDGQAVGVTPYRGALFAGPHQITLRKGGHSEYSQPIEVRDAETAQVVATLPAEGLPRLPRARR